MKSFGEIMKNKAAKRAVRIAILCGVMATSIWQAAATSETYVPDEMIASVSSLEEAEAVAAYYGVELESYAYGVAVYHTPNMEVSTPLARTFSVMPTLSPNYLYTLYEDETTVYDDETTVYAGEASVMWEYSPLQYQHDIIDSSDAWQVSTGEGVVVAIIDTGVYTDHVALTHAISADRCYNSHLETYGFTAVEDDHGHGTHVAGIVAAASESAGVYGVAPDVELMIIKADNDENLFELASLVRAINYAVANGADIINMSLGYSYDVGSYADEKTAIDAAVAAGVTVICAAGNDKDDNAAYPAAYDNTIAVTAVGSDYEFESWYSNYGAQVDIAAPGTSIYSTYYTGGYGYKSGTSMATPVVSGVAALMLAENPSLTNEEIREILCDTAVDAGTSGWDKYYGYGIVNAYAALQVDENYYKVTYYDDGEVVSTVMVAKDTAIAQPAYFIGETDFLGWTTTPYGETEWDFNDPVTADMQLHAKWDLETGEYYITVTDATTEEESTAFVVVCDVETLLGDADNDITVAAYKSIQLVLALYENGKMQTTAVTLGVTDEFTLTTYCEGLPDSAKLFVLGDGLPLISAVMYSLGSESET